MAKKTKQSFWDTASQAPSAVSLVIGFLLLLAGIAFPSVLAFLVNIAGIVLVLSGIIGIYMLGGANRKR